MVKIERAQERHIPDIIEIWKEFMDFHKERDSFFTRSKEGHVKFEEYLKEVMTSERAQVLVALEEKKMIAYLLASIAEHPPVFERSTYGSINDLAVKREHRRQEIGSRLLTQVQEWFSQHGVKRIEVRVATENEVAVSFWRKHGFKEYLKRMYREL
ncbi:MAG: GNAT family N-acetyltransferase [Candidatus Korarchaeota archaeon]|nr:GNAT family N-acetyltransferase [Candidatus Korarchaeota archaeon]NIU82301.1 GNAT family N-acetyltransferase [Candidatus Thorarchaeota archaeon]NIW12789.1 GNAT family N-acetyltransferase [Candidatus Thorarchaeota archaeon]NIW50995.1 GNAT family N-acetyltransferase [Candidatus Korarchaeota archaeon]